MEGRLGARAVAGLQSRVAEPQLRLTVARIVAPESFERVQEGQTGELARRDLRDARGHLTAIFRIRAITECRLLIAD